MGNLKVREGKTNKTSMKKFPWAEEREMERPSVPHKVKDKTPTPDTPAQVLLYQACREDSGSLAGGKKKLSTKERRRAGISAVVLGFCGRAFGLLIITIQNLEFYTQPNSPAWLTAKQSRVRSTRAQNMHFPSETTFERERKT